MNGVKVKTFSLVQIHHQQHLGRLDVDGEALRQVPPAS